MTNNNKEELISREKEVEAIIKIITKQDQLFKKDISKAIAINSPWGTGKTTFIESIKSKIDRENNSGAKVVKFNAWENDYHEHPLLPLTREVVKAVAEIKGDKKDEKGAEFFNYENNKKVFIDIAKIVGKNIFKKLDDNVAKEVAEYIYNRNIENGEVSTEKKDEGEGEDTLESIRKYLKDITEDQNIILIIDELDRCKPLFAIQLLEMVKHLYSGASILFIFSVDMEQIKHSIATMYGQNMDAYGYLRRFFTYIIDLPEITTEEYLNLKLKDLSQDSEGGRDNRNILREELGAIKDSINTDSSLYKIYSDLNLSLRDMDIIIQNTILFLTITEYKEERENDIKLALALIAIKYKDPLRYRNIAGEIITSEKGSVFGSSYRSSTTSSQLHAIISEDETIEQCIARIKRSIEILNILPEE